MTNKEFAQELKKITKPKFTIREAAEILGITPQRLTYWTRIKSVLDPNEQCPFNLDKFKGE